MRRPIRHRPEGDATPRRRRPLVLSLALGVATLAVLGAAPARADDPPADPGTPVVVAPDPPPVDPGPVDPAPVVDPPQADPVPADPAPTTTSTTPSSASTAPSHHHVAAPSVHTKAHHGSKKTTHAATTASPLVTPRAGWWTPPISSQGVSPSTSPLPSTPAKHHPAVRQAEAAAVPSRLPVVSDRATLAAQTLIASASASALPPWLTALALAVILAIACSLLLYRRLLDRDIP